MHLYLLTIILFFILDQSGKYFAGLYLSDIVTYPVIEGVFHLTYSENTGISFGMFRGHTLLFGIISAVLAAALLVFLFMQFKKYPSKKLYLLSLSLIISGALGNMTDRLFRGFVIDFFDFRLINFAIFNIADSAISVGAVIFCAYILFDKEIFGDKKDVTQQ